MSIYRIFDFNKIIFSCLFLAYSNRMKKFFGPVRRCTDFKFIFIRWPERAAVRMRLRWKKPGLLIAVALRYRHCSGATFTVAVAVAPLLLAESSGDSSAATFLATFLALFATATFKKEN